MTEESRIRSALSAKRQQSSKESSLEFQYDQDKLEQENRYRVEGTAFPEKLNKFNWGACILSPVWGLFNNSPIACLTILLSFIPYLGWIFAIIFSIYCGIKGNEWAWANKEWVDLKHFHTVQRRWAAAGLVTELLIITVSVIACIVVLDGIYQNL